MRGDNISPNAVHSSSTVPNPMQRRTDGTAQTLIGRHSPHHGSVMNNSSADARRSSTNVRPEARRQFHGAASLADGAIDQRRRDLSLLSRPSRSPVGALTRGTSETFSELVRRRAARADAQAWAARRSPSPESVFRSAYRIPRPSYLSEEAETSRRRERLAELETRHNPAATGQTSTGATGSSGESPPVYRNRELVRQEMRDAGLLLQRSVAPRHTPGDSTSRTRDYLTSISTESDRLVSFGRRHPSNQYNNPRTTTPSITSERQRNFMLGLGLSSPSHSESEGNDRERERLRDTISRRSRDDEDARRALSNLGRSPNSISGDAMSTRNLQRRLRESEVDVSRALRALDQWGELEGSSERDVDPAQSRMHRFGETMRRRRVPPPFNFASTAADNDSSGLASSSAARQRRRSPSPPSAAARLQSRQARFARAQGRFRELPGDMFGESRTPGSFASRLDMFGGSRMTSRFLSRSLGDYMVSDRRAWV
jgi:hypothetical protein